MFLKLMSESITQNKQRGSALVLAIFIIVVMTLLGSALVRMIGTNAETIAYEVIGTRAYQAAQAGVQRKMSELFPLNQGVNVCEDNIIPYDFSAIEGLENCKAEIVTCNLDALVKGVSYYTVTSIGQCSVAGVFTSRKIEMKARSL
ncbi:MAG: pilus assembly PilX N-terminal domain-containing protein [Colwellia sp.]|nr:pilus assembly PilX N-terminal domain-containing protein [Colwellia sp.]